MTCLQKLWPLAALILLPACEAQPPAAEARDLSARAAVAPTPPETVSPAEVGELHMLVNEVVLLDVRTPEEFADGHIDGARNIDFQGEDFAARIAKLDRNADYVVYCHSGRRSAAAQQAMIDMGFTRVANMEGGILAWQELGLPTVR